VPPPHANHPLSRRCHVQALGSLKAFAAGGTAAYRELMGWTDTISASPLSVSALQCVWKPPFLLQYVVTVALPLLAAGAVMAIFLTATAARAVCRRRKASPTSDLSASVGFWAVVAAWLEQRRHVATLVVSGDGRGPRLAHCPTAVVARPSQFVLFVAYMSIVSSSLRALDCTVPIDGVRYLRGDLRVACGVGEHAAGSVIAYLVLAGLGLGFPALVYTQLSRAGPRQFSSAAFAGSWGLMYDGYRRDPAPAVGEAPPHPTAGLPLKPRSRASTVRATLLHAGASHLAVGGDRVSGADDIAFQSNPLAAALTRGPVSVAAEARGTALPPPAAGRHDADGLYRATCGVCAAALAHRHAAWWEAVVLLRKLGILLLATLVQNAYFQSVGAALLLGGCLILHLRVLPYEAALFNVLEAVSLASAMSTAMVASLLLQYDVRDPAFTTQPPAAMTATQWGVTVVLGALALSTCLVLAAVWLYLQCCEARAATRTTRKWIKATARAHSSTASPRTSSRHLDGSAKAAAGASTVGPLTATRVGGRVSAVMVDGPPLITRGGSVRSHSTVAALQWHQSGGAGAAAFPPVPSSHA
jgi:hypothetical protein